MPSFPLTSPQSPETMTFSIGMPSRLSAGEITSHTQPSLLLLMLCIILHILPHFLFWYYLLWNHEGMTSKGGMPWKVADEMKEWHDKQLGAMRCTFSSHHSVFYTHTFLSRYFLLPPGLFTSVIRVFCIVLASTYRTLTFECSISTVTQCSLHSVFLFML